MRYLHRQSQRLGVVFCAVSQKRIEPTEECWHEPVRNWHAKLEKGEKFDFWISVIEDALRTKTPIREAMLKISSAHVAPEPPLCTLSKVIDIRTKKPIQGSLF